MRLKTRLLLSAGLLAGVLAPRSLAYGQAEMYTYSSLTQQGDIVYAFAVADLEYPMSACQYPYGSDCWDWYDAWVRISLYKDCGWRGTEYYASQDYEAWAQICENASTGSWQLTSEFEVEVEWEDWEYGEYGTGTGTSSVTLMSMN